MPEAIHQIMHLSFVFVTAGVFYWLVRNKIRAVQEGEARLMAIIENVPAAISAKDAEGRYILANREFLARNGLENKEFLGKTEEELAPSCRDDSPTLQSVRTENGRSSFTEETIDRDGNPCFFSVSVFPITDRDGNAGGVGRLCTDVTEQKRVELALRESEARLRAIVDHSTASIILVEPDGRYALVNTEFEKRHGVTRKDILGRTAADIYPEKVAKHLRWIGDQVVESGEARTEDIRIGHVDGTVHDHVLTVFPVRDSNDAIAGVGAIGVDVTDRKRIERRLAENAALFRASWNNAPILFNLKDTAGRYLFCNQTHLEWHGRQLGEVVGKKAAELFSGELAAVYDETDEEALSSGETCERVAELEYPDGKTRRILGIKFPVYMESGELLGVGGVSVDITERQRTEKALEESERLFRTFIDNSPVGFALKDRDGRLRMMNRHYRRILGLRPEEAIGKTDFDIRTRENALKAREWDRRVMDARIPLTYEARRPASDSEAGVYLVTKFPVFDADGHVDGIGFCSLDITERENAQNALRFAQTALEKTQDALFWLDRDGWFVNVNEASCRLTGYSREELLQMRVPDLDPDVDDEMYDRLWRQSLKTKRLVLQSRCRKRDGTIFPMEITANMIEFEDKPYQFVTMLDISEQVAADRRNRELQMELAHVSRLSTLGEMGAGFAHELNQPLAAIANFAGGALRRISSNKTDVVELVGAFERIAEQARRAGAITNRIRKFVSKDPPEKIPSDVNAAIRDAVGLLSNEALRYDVDVVTRLAGNLEPVLADPVQIQQLV
ncbi:MAG: PAS domain S-box protein, partial [Rhodospirillales bacterium]|nr:PAS domain S-box protein [Rhodospirillales bacterium]